MARVVVIGSGPAGVSAALYARRGGAEVTVVSRGEQTGALAKAHLIENYYGLEEPVSGAELLRRGIAGARKLGVEFTEDEVLSLAFDDSFTGFLVEGRKAKLAADSVILAAGAARSSLKLPGIAAFEGKGVSYCAVCDAFFYRGKAVAVIGAGEYALHEAQALLPHAARVVLLTNGAEPAVAVPADIEVQTGALAAIEGETRVAGLLMAVRWIRMVYSWPWGRPAARSWHASLASCWRAITSRPMRIWRRMCRASLRLATARAVSCR